MKAIHPPSPYGSNGRDTRGRYLKGNAGVPGNPNLAQVVRWMAMLKSSITENDIAAYGSALV